MSNGERTGDGFDHGWREQPDFSSMSDAALKLQEAIIDENIRWNEIDDPLLATNYRQQMRALNAERARRNGGSNSFLPHKSDIGKATNFNPVSAAEILNRETPSIPYLLDGYIPRGILALLIAYMKTGKSTWVYRLIVCIAQGILFLGRKTEPGAVLVLAVEEHPRDIERRLRRFGMREGDPIYIHMGRIQQPNECPQNVKQFMVEKGIALLVIDSLSRFWNVQDENNNMEVYTGTLTFT